MKRPRDIKGGAEVVGPELLRRLRQIVSPSGKKGTWLRKLNDRRLAEVYMRLTHGQSAFLISQIAQREWNVMTTSATRSLCRAVYVFSKEALGDIKTTAIEAPSNDEEGKKSTNLELRRRRLGEKLDAMGRLAWTIEQQTDRFQLSLDLEKKTKIPLKHTDVIVKRLGGLLDTYLDYAVKLGLVDAKPPELSLKVKHMFDGFVGDLGDDGQRVMTAAHRFLEMATQESMTLAMGEDGAYRLQRPEPAPEAAEAMEVTKETEDVQA